MKKHKDRIFHRFVETLLFKTLVDFNAGNRPMPTPDSLLHSALTLLEFERNMEYVQKNEGQKSSGNMYV